MAKWCLWLAMISGLACLAVGVLAAAAIPKSGLEPISYSLVGFGMGAVILLGCTVAEWFGVGQFEEEVDSSNEGQSDVSPDGLRR